MATPLTASQMLAALKAEGLVVVETKGWATRGRDSATGKPFGPVHGVMTHHTGSDTTNPGQYVQNILVSGYAGLPGPLCHVGIDSDGRVWMVAAGRSNHAGGGDGPGGSQDVLALVEADAMPLDREVHPTERNLGGDDGNDVSYGAEVMYSGGHPMTPAQYDATVRWNAAMCRAHGWTSGSCLGHREWSMDKSDPGHCDMAQLRRDVAARLAQPPAGPAPAQGDLTMSDVSTILDALRAQAKVDADRYQVDAARYRDIAARGIRTESALKALAAGLGPTVEKAVADALADVVVNVDIDVNGQAAS